MKWLNIIFVPALAACSMQQIDMTIGPEIVDGPDTIRGITRLERQNYGSEPTVFVWENKLLYIANDRGNGIINIIDFSTDILIRSISTDFAFPNIYIQNEKAYLYGERSDGNIYEMNSTDLKIWTIPVLVLVAPIGHYDINPSIIWDGNRYVMVYEEWIDGGNNSNSGYVKFSASQDLMNWKRLGINFLNNSYAGGPTLKYIKGCYYLFYLVNGIHGSNLPSDSDPFYTQVAKSIDLSSWEINTQDFVPISPRKTDNEGSNASDLEMQEYSGKIYMIYYIGDQSTWGMTRKAVFEGTMETFVNSFFK